MSERYKRLYSLTSNLYAEGSPVIIEAGSLLLDTQNGNVLAQLKFNSLSNRKIIALKVEVRSFDPAGREIGSPVYHQYLDLCVAMGGSFGAKVPVYLPDAGTRSFSAKATEVIFEDEDVWTGDENAQWTVLASQGKLNLDDPELTKEYRLKYGKQCEYTYLKEKDLWYCPCGAVNKEESCYRCKLLQAELDGFDMEALKQSCEERLRNEEIARKDAILAEGKAKMTGESVSNYESAIKLFEQISGWKDADEQLSICQRKIEEIDLAHKRRIEIARKEAERKAKRNKRIAIITTSIVCAVIAFIIVLNSVIIPNGKYNDAVALMEAGKYNEAIAAFEALNGYKDSTTQINNCNTAIMDGKYNDAVSLMEAGKYNEAIAAFKALNGYKDSTTQINNCNTAIKDGKYNDAIALMDAGKYKEAITAFLALDGYKDSVAQIKECEVSLYGEKYVNTNIGDYMNFGTYEQDNNTSNGKEAVEWLVLDKQDGKVLVISKYALDCQQYNTSYTNVTWETCSLRKWLNNTFISNAFSAEEQAKIQTTTVSADKNPSYSTNPGNATQDKVFLLSIAEANKYFNSDEARMCGTTEYAIAQGASTSDSYSAGGKATCWWWLRSPGSSQDSAAYVILDGAVLELGRFVDGDDDAVRPALWITLDS